MSRGDRHRRRYVRRVPKYRYERNVIGALERRIQDYAPESGTDPGTAPTPREGEVAYVGARLFSQLPISQRTLQGLTEAGYVEMTDIQRSALPHGLPGRDVLGAAKTGSGKTLVFLITILEKLYRLQWTRMDGLGALILSPVRELALQIFEELQKVGKHHDFSAGLLIGGKDVDVEKGRIGMMNILIGTPGRVLHHLDETVGFDVMQLQVLVLDEADRLLDMGFAKMLDAVIGHLPKERQSMLFSATQTKSVKDLVRLSLTDPEYLAVHAEAPTATPAKLKQFYVTCALHEKTTILWSFIKTHPRSKIIVFVSTCTQVRFLFEALKKLLSNQHVCCLHGRIKQNKRTETFYQFCESKAMVLLATDVAARGLDFPEVDWVVQMDCTDTVSEYIHRVGRTARYTADGQALLLLMPQEEHFLPKLEKRQIPLKHMKLKKSALTCPTIALQSLLTKAPKMKECAKKAIITYLKSYMLNSNNSVQGLDVEAFAQSMGLMAIPSSKALKKIIRRVQPMAQLPTTSDATKDEVNGRQEIQRTTDQDDDEELFVRMACPSTTEEAPDVEMRNEAPPLLSSLSEFWGREKEDGTGGEGELDAGVFTTPQNRFEQMKSVLKQRTAEDRAFVKAWKKRAAQTSNETRQNNNDADSYAPCLSSPVPTESAGECSELEEVESVEADDISIDDASTSEDHRMDQKSKRRKHFHDEVVATGPTINV